MLTTLTAADTPTSAKSRTEVLLMTLKGGYCDNHAAATWTPDRHTWLSKLSMKADTCNSTSRPQQSKQHKMAQMPTLESSRFPASLTMSAVDCCGRVGGPGKAMSDAALTGCICCLTASLPGCCLRPAGYRQVLCACTACRQTARLRLLLQTEGKHDWLLCNSISCRGCHPWAKQDL